MVDHADYVLIWCSRAGAMGLINSSGNVGGWVGPYMLGFINGHTGSFTMRLLRNGRMHVPCRSIDFNTSKIYGTQG